MRSTLLTIALSALVSTSSFANNSDFKTAYNNYINAIESGQPAKEYAKQAYELGLVKFGDNAQSTANLAVNYANALSAIDKQERVQREELYEQAIDILSQTKGELDISLLDPLLGLTETTRRFSIAEDSTERAVEIAEHTKDDAFIAQIKLTFAEALLKKFSDKRRSIIKEYLMDAQQYYAHNQVENSLDNVKVNMYLGVYHSRFGKLATAEGHLNQVIKVFDDNLDFDHPLELQAHSLLVDLYEDKGLSERATKHCLAIAQMTPWTDDEEQVPLYRVHPSPSISAWQSTKKGEKIAVELEITVDRAGFVTDANVLFAQGHVGFKKAALEAIEKWRYAPKFENGKPVEAKTKIRFDFELG
ncbi:energy transducer TonB [Pseudoalteromonas sp. SSDWG2]|uniref:energy transducer TonB n=1 Tax=Pseudoalteromonas sp. SSDWG2 TaxID=3139391 RepID=UPI003BAB9B64